MITPKLETDRLILREIHRDDTETIFTCWMQDKDVSRYMWWKASDDINDDEKHWDISYNLGKKFWGNGYVTEAMRVVMKYAVEVMKIKEISTTYAVDNPASGHVLRKLGFQFVKEVPYECNGGDIVTTGRYCRYKADNLINLRS